MVNVNTLLYLAACAISTSQATMSKGQDYCYYVSDPTSNYYDQYVLAKYYNGDSNPKHRGVFCAQWEDGDGPCATFDNFEDCEDYYDYDDRDNYDIFTKRCHRQDMKKKNGWCREVRNYERRHN
eukprot:Awhi_evm1s12038